MRIYFDSNIFRRLKHSSAQFRQDLFQATDSIKDHFIFPFSEAHCNDLSTSTEQFRNEDLKQMENYTKDNFIHRDHIKKEIKYSLATPLQAYGSYDYEAAQAFLTDPLKGVESIFDFEGGEQLKELYQQLLDMPVFNPGQIQTENLPIEYQKIADRFMGITTIREALSGMHGIGDFLNDKSILHKNRGLFNSYVNREDYSFDNWSFEFGERMKDTAFGKSFSEMIEIMTAEADRNDLYTNFINTYVNLEFLGVTQERSGSKQKLKKNSFMDIQKDAAHAFFASKSDYFVTDDIGVQQKAFIAYRLFNMPTEVLSMQDFMDKIPYLLANETDSIKAFDTLIRTNLHDSEIAYQSEDKTLSLLIARSPILNYFNRIQLETAINQSGIILLRNCKNNTIVLFSEILLIIEKCTRIFGEPTYLPEQNAAKPIADYQIGEPIRVWLLSGAYVQVSWGKLDSGVAVVLLGIFPLTSDGQKPQE